MMVYEEKEVVQSCPELRGSEFWRLFAVFRVLGFRLRHPGCLFRSQEVGLEAFVQGSFGLGYRK